MVEDRNPKEGQEISDKNGQNKDFLREEVLARFIESRLNVCQLLASKLKEETSDKLLENYNELLRLNSKFQQNDKGYISEVENFARKLESELKVLLKEIKEYKEEGHGEDHKTGEHAKGEHEKEVPLEKDKHKPEEKKVLQETAKKTQDIAEEKLTSPFMELNKSYDMWILWKNLIMEYLNGWGNSDKKNIYGACLQLIRILENLKININGVITLGIDLNASKTSIKESIKELEKYKEFLSDITKAAKGKDVDMDKYERSGITKDGFKNQIEEIDKIISNIKETLKRSQH